MPLFNASSCARIVAASQSASVAGGTERSASSLARSWRTPVGAPDASRKIAPPSGAIVSFPIFAARSAAVLSQREWPSRLRITAGRSPVTRSRSAAVGQRPQLFLSNRPPVSHCPGPRSRARRPISSRASSMVLVSRRSISAIWKPHHMKWTCASNQPGVIRPPRRSTRSAVPASRARSDARPTAATRPSRARRASAETPDRTWIRPPWKRVELRNRIRRGRGAGRISPHRAASHVHPDSGRPGAAFPHFPPEPR